MSPKKKKRPGAAQQLIDTLLDEKSAKKGSASGSYESNPILLESDIDATGLELEISKPMALDPIAQAQKTHMAQQDATRFASGDPAATRVASASEAPPFDGTRPVVTQMGNYEPTKMVPEQTTSDIRDFAAISAHEASDDENTLKLDLAKPKAKPEPVQEQSRTFDRGGATEIRDGVKVPPSPSTNTMAFASSEAALKQSESLRIAQSRITELEKELERVRRDNEDLATAGDTLRRRADELISKAERFEIQASESQRIADEERKVLRGQLQAKDRENAELKARVEEIELRLESNFKKIRVRERELEHRLEIVKMESATLVSTKDKMILDLKRQIDQLTHENDHAKHKTQELFNQYKDKQETIRRVVRALRIALTILEGDDETVVPLKKAE